MNKKITLVVALLAYVAFVVLSLLRGATYLELSFPGGLPLGNLMVGLGLSAMAGAALVLSVRGSALYVASIISLFGAALWLPVSIALAGNPELNFSGGRGSAWLTLSVVVLAGACSTLLWALGASALARVRGVAAP